MLGFDPSSGDQVILRRMILRQAISGIVDLSLIEALLCPFISTIHEPGGGGGSSIRTHTTGQSMG